MYFDSDKKKSENENAPTGSSQSKSAGKENKPEERKKSLKKDTRVKIKVYGFWENKNN